MLGILFAAAVWINPVVNYHYDKWGTELPPPSYDYYPTRPIMRIAVPLEEVTPTCFSAPVGFVADGCTKSNKEDILSFTRNKNVLLWVRQKVGKQLTKYPDLCLIIYPELSQKVPLGRQWGILRHENVHCNGAFHMPDGRGWYKEDGTPVPDQ